MTSSNDLTGLDNRLRRFSSARRGLLNRTLAYHVGTFAVAAGTVGLLFLGGWLTNLWVNVGLFGLLALWLISLGVVLIVRRRRFRSCLEEAFHIEGLAGSLNSRIVSAWDFATNGPATPLTRAVIDRAAADLQADYEGRLSRAGRNRRRKQFAVVLALFLAIGLTPWFSFGNLVNNVDRCWRELNERLFPLDYVLEPGPGQHVHRVGDRVEVSLRFRDRARSEVELVTSSADDSHSETLSVGDDGVARATVTSDVEAVRTMRFEIGDEKSDDVVLIFTHPPLLTNMQTELVYPAYTRLPPRSLESVQQRLLALPNTRISLGFTFTKELESATITWDDGSTLPMEVTGRYATVSLLHTRARQATLQVRDIHGLALDAPLVIDFELQLDEKPVVLLPRHLKDDMPLLPEAAKQFGFGVQATDDYGVTRVVLRWQKSTVENPAAVVDRGEIERLISPAQPRAVVNFEKPFSGLELRPGDRVGFVVEAQDNRAPEKQTTASRRCSFFVFQEGLGDLTVRELGFGNDDPLGRERIAKSTRATAVKEPEGLRTKEQVRNEFESKLSTPTQAPTVRGEHAQAVQDYFRLLSTVKYPEEEKKPK